MVYLTIDPAGEVLCASAGHPEPRLLRPDGRVETLPAGGLALGIDGSQTYEQVRAELPPGGAVVIYTDGVIEARTGRDLFGVERLDALLAERAGNPPQAIAEAVIEACRAFSGGNLADDCAVVVIKR
jgi:serine phosphatase RsbU (regulator of sigma subunit)